jgi:hypothetical protein
MAQLEASFTVINYAPRVVNYSPREHLYTGATHDDHHVMIKIFLLVTNL